MRVSSFYRFTVRGGRPRGAVASRARIHLAVLVALALPATASATQWPGELSGRIVDSLTKTALGAVEVLVEPGARSAGRQTWEVVVDESAEPAAEPREAAFIARSTVSGVDLEPGREG